MHRKLNGLIPLKVSVLLFILILLPLRTAAQSNDPQRDSQIWPDAQVALKLRPDLRLIFYGTLRLGRDDSALISERAGVGMSKSFGEHFSSGAFYYYIRSEPTPTRRSSEHRIFVDLTPRRALGKGFLVQNRHRIEWRDVNQRTSWRYRNRVQFERPFNLGERRVTPYVAGETFYDTRFRTWSRQQIYVGARLPLSQHVTLDAFYSRTWDARTRPGFLNIIGAFWRLEF